jgi:hypothetical protein
MYKMEVIKSKVGLLTTQVTTLEGLLRQVLEEQILVNLPQQPIPATILFLPPPQPQPPQPVHVPLRTVKQLNMMPWQPTIKQPFPKTWSNHSSGMALQRLRQLPTSGSVGL